LHKAWEVTLEVGLEIAWVVALVVVRQSVPMEGVLGIWDFQVKGAEGSDSMAGGCKMR